MCTHRHYHCTLCPPRDCRRYRVRGASKHTCTDTSNQMISFHYLFNQIPSTIKNQLLSLSISNGLASKITTDIRLSRSIIGGQVVWTALCSGTNVRSADRSSGRGIPCRRTHSSAAATLQMLAPLGSLK